MKTNCPHCNRKYDLGKTPLGGKVKCYGCNNSFLLPHSISILKKDGPPTEDISKAAAASIPTFQPPAADSKNTKLLGKILAEFLMLIAFVLAFAAVAGIFYNKISVQTGIVIALSACVIILIPILMNLKEINHKLKK